MFVHMSDTSMALLGVTVSVTHPLRHTYGPVHVTPCHTLVPPLRLRHAVFSQIVSYSVGGLKSADYVFGAEQLVPRVAEVSGSAWRHATTTRTHLISSYTLVSVESHFPLVANDVFSK